ncbi:hypothetical protein J4463_04445 [Candidatus Pacearchaeota archaeon]|nr:hypothetical protein [Candidatus Pacearchaeota archaeon]
MEGAQEAEKAMGVDGLVVILSGIVEDGTIARCPSLYEQIRELITNPENRKHPAFEGFGYHVVSGGAFNYSEEFSRDWTIILEGYNGSIERISGALGACLIRPAFKDIAELVRNKFSEADYEFLQSLGKQIKVKERYSVQSSSSSED